MLLSQCPGAFKDAADFEPIPGVDRVDANPYETATMVLWTIGVASVGLITDQAAEDTADSLLNAGSAAWRSADAAKAAAEAEMRDMYGDEAPAAPFAWAEEDTCDGRKQYRYAAAWLEDVYLVHPVWVMD